MTMSVGTTTIEIYLGEDAVLTFTMSPVENITGWTIGFTVEGSAPEKIIEKNAVVTDGPGGVFTVTLAAVDSESLAPGSYQYDVWRMDTGSRRVLALGSFRILDVARLPADV